MKIKNIKKIQLEPSDVLIVNYDLGNLPPHRVKTLLEEVREKMTTLFPSNHVLVISQNMQIDILSPALVKPIE